MDAVSLQILDLSPTSVFVDDRSMAGELTMLVSVMVDAAFRCPMTNENIATQRTNVDAAVTISNRC